MSASSTNGSSNANGSGGGGVRFTARFKHWRSGKIIEAKDYGYKGFPIGRKGK